MYRQAPPIINTKTKGLSTKKEVVQQCLYLVIKFTLPVIIFKKMKVYKANVLERLYFKHTL